MAARFGKMSFDEFKDLVETMAKRFVKSKGYQENWVSVTGISKHYRGEFNYDVDAAVKGVYLDVQSSYDEHQVLENGY